VRNENGTHLIFCCKKTGFRKIISTKETEFVPERKKLVHVWFLKSHWPMQ
jgi:hypothetical protein